MSSWVTDIKLSRKAGGKTRCQNIMQVNAIYKKQPNQPTNPNKQTKYHKTKNPQTKKPTTKPKIPPPKQFFNVSVKRFFPNPSNILRSWSFSKLISVIYAEAQACLQENLPFPFSFFRKCVVIYYLCSTDYWNVGWRNAISLLLEMNQFEMPELFEYLSLEMPAVLKMSVVPHIAFT